MFIIIIKVMEGRVVVGQKIKNKKREPLSHLSIGQKERKIRKKEKSKVTSNFLLTTFKMVDVK